MAVEYPDDSRPYSIHSTGGERMQTESVTNPLSSASLPQQVFALLRETNANLAGNQSHAEALERVLHAIKSFGFDRVRLYKLSEDGVMTAKAHVGMEPSFVGMAWALAEDFYMQRLLNHPSPHICRRSDSPLLPHEKEIGKEGVEEWACLPLILRGRVIGQIAADNKHSRRQISEAELNDLALFAAQATAVLALEQAEMRSRKLAAVLKVSEAVNSSLDLEQIFQITCRAAVESLEIDHSALVRFDPDLKQIHVQAEYPGIGAHDKRISAHGIPVEEDLIKNRRPVFIQNVSQETALGEVRDVLNELKIRSILVVPIVSQNRVSGHFCLNAINRQRIFTNEEIEICQVIAAQAAVAIENARLFEKTRHQVRKLESLRRTTLQISAPPNPDQILSTFPAERLGEIVEEAARLLRAKSSGIYQFDSEREELTLVADYQRPDHLGKKLKLGEGLAGKLVQSDEPYYIVDNYDAWPGQAQIYSAGRVFGAVLEVPLRWRDRIIGVLYVDDKVGRHFTEQDARTLALFAEQIVSDTEASYLKQLVDSSPNAIIAIDTQGRVLQFNEKARQIHGYTEEEVVGQPVEMLYWDPQTPREIGRLLRESPDGRLNGYITSIKSKASPMGEPIPIPIVLAATWLFDSQNNRIGSVGYFTDLSSIEKSKRYQMSLTRASRLAAESKDLLKGLQELAEVAATIQPDDAFCQILLLDGEQKNLVVKAASYPKAMAGDISKSRADRECRIPILKWPGLSQRLDLGCSFTLGRQDPLRSYFIRFYRSLGLKQEFDRLLLVPLKTDGRLVGLITIGLLPSDQSISLSHEETSFAIEIAEQAVDLIDLTRIRQVAKVADFAKEIAQLITLGDLDKTLSSITHETVSALGCQAVVLYVYDHTRNKLHYPPKQTGVWYPQKAWPNDQVPPNSIVYQIMNDTQPWIVKSVREDPCFNGRRFTRVEKIESLAAISLRVADNPVGVMFFNYREPKNFTAEVIEIIKFFADQAAVAVSNAQLYEGRAKGLDDQRALIDLSNDLLKTLDYQEVFDRVVRAASKLLKAELCSIVMPENLNLPGKLNDLVLKAGVGWDDQLISKQALPTGYGSHAGYILMTRTPIVVDDYRLERRFQLPEVAKDHGVRAGMGVPIWIEGKAIGALLVQSREPRHFSEGEQYLLTLIANLAASAIQTAWQYQGATTLALVGLADSTWRHSVVNHANTIRTLALLFRRGLGKNLLPSLGITPARKVGETLEQIENLAVRILEKPLIPPSEKEGVEAVRLNEFIRQQIRPLWRNEPYRAVTPHWHLRLDEAATLRVHPEWLRIGLELLINNAVKAMERCELRELTVVTRRVRNQAEISIADTGNGLPDDVLAKLFLGRIDKPLGDGEGSGIGMLIAQAIFHTYRGDIRVAKTDPEGTEIVVRLPLEQNLK